MASAGQEKSHETCSYDSRPRRLRPSWRLTSGGERKYMQRVHSYVTANIAFIILDFGHDLALALNVLLYLSRMVIYVTHKEVGIIVCCLDLVFGCICLE